MRARRPDAWTFRNRPFRDSQHAIPSRSGCGSARGRPDRFLLNLLSNAVKFTLKGDVELIARVEAAEVVFVVRDRGIGIAAENRERIFQKFWQVEQGHSRTNEGAGLGLSVTRRLARLMGGDVTVRERAGGGSEFEARLPADGHGPVGKRDSGQG